MKTPASASDAIAQQNELRSKVSLENDFGMLRLVAGVDVSHKNDMSQAAVVVMRWGEWQPLESVTAEMPTEFPYIPGLLSFREIPVILKALSLLQSHPDLLMVDGHGVAHPRGLGIAAHLGVLTGKPALGVAKSRLVGNYAEVALQKGMSSPLMHKGQQIGTVLRSKEKCLPLFISPGHRLDHETAVRLTLEALTRYRLPEPTRQADKLSKIKS